MAKVIMVQGTMSNAGKSIVVAGLCRIFKQDGYKVTPFKSQNMALNSYITKEGLEMGRAQVVQAEAAGIEPSVLMNPILLKPTTDVGSQVILHGEVLGNMSASEYLKKKQELIPEIMKAYNELDKEYDIIVIEGAGSPAEINLNAVDIVNMGMAKLVDAPVLLVGDIDRGGVFAQLYGTIALLKEEDRNRVKAMIINKFRGDVTILQPGLTMLTERLSDIADIPFAGVIPYMKVDIDDEDSLSERIDRRDISYMDSDKKGSIIDIAVIRFPHISNFTDVNPLERYEQVSVRYVSNANELRYPDMILLPGTKSTIADLKWMRQNGLEALIHKAADQGTLIFGICGGYQMLGKYLADPYEMEGGGEVKGMSLLPMATIFEREKTRKQISCKLTRVTGILSDLTDELVTGYEIHMGVSESLEDFDVSDNKKDDTIEDECILKNYMNIYGTYVHGFFDEDAIVRKLMEALCMSKNLDFDMLISDMQKSKEQSLKEYKNQQYDILADTVRKALDMNLIYKILEESV